ncbi:M20/M25/M40 family metallo-hydrolase [Epidermidibacterium keratini]|uniref:M20/M25/M40 family metallo-hydrolase n=1 Tax=Epidermidibacterium keratini TaxID=1891644 RepID=A0A7L4YKG6_9ACTN|nr:M20/M25/M40 family metallo-hydrolase [Epidermidibacterium keratini]QHB99619.1 M20/M25/M40 family metallo-hydrolase [Epidermidibacterium keratini]
MTPVEELLGELIAIPSINPRGEHAPAETPVAQFVARWAQERGMQAELDEVVDGRCNVVVTVSGESDETILLETHLDTVEVDSDELLTARRDNDRIYGRGACDAKGPLAVFLCAMAAVAERGRPARTIVLAAVIDEEHQYQGVQAFRRRALRPIGGIIGEPTELRMVTAHKGCMRCRINATGPGGHSSEPWDKINPIAVVAEIATYLSETVARELETQPAPLVGPPSLSVTEVRGGRGPNVLPDFASIGIDRRTVAGEDPHEVWEQLRANLVSRWPNGVEVEEPHTVDYALHTASDDPFVVEVAQTLTDHGLDATSVGVGHGTDASKLALDGIPCIVFGPGSIGHAHTAGEFVPVADLHRAQAVVEQLLAGGVR